MATPTNAKNLTVSITVVISVIMALGTTIVNLYDKGTESRFETIEKKIEHIDSAHNEDVSVLHRRLTDNKTEINALQINLAGYNANLTRLSQDVSEIKTDLKELIRSKGGSSKDTTLEELMRFIKENMDKEP